MAVKISGTTVIDDSRNITTDVGTVDGRNVASDGTKLDGIATGADVTADNIGGALTGLGTITSVASNDCLLYTSPSPRDGLLSRMPSSA